LILFDNAFKCSNYNAKIAFYFILVLSGYFLLSNLFSIPDILASSQNHTGNDSIITTTGEATQIHSGHSNPITKTNGLLNNLSGNGKVVILTFGDTEKSQFATAKPILDQYGYKASFFITCGYVGQTHRLNWNDIIALQQDGQDIESKGMTHADLNNLSSSALDFEIGGSKQCLQTHGINSPNIFAAVHGDVGNNPVVIDTISKYYGYADDGFANLMFLHCDGYDSKQTNCQTYDGSDTLSYANRYSIRETSHNSWDARYLHNDQVIFQMFVKEVNSGVAANNNIGMVDAIPIVAYHIIDNSKDPSSTDINLFAAEMKYLHDNDFKVIPMSDLGYDESTNHMYIE
jgi:peptidoglycan/xylan/chitin deacetylase (PgdA/CDA1 family)